MQKEDLTPSLPKLQKLYEIVQHPSKAHRRQVLIHDSTLRSILSINFSLGKFAPFKRKIHRNDETYEERPYQCDCEYCNASEVPDLIRVFEEILSKEEYYQKLVYIIADGMNTNGEQAVNWKYEQKKHCVLTRCVQDEKVIIPVSTVKTNEGAEISTVDAVARLQHVNILIDSFVSTMDLTLNARNGSICVPAGSTVNANSAFEIYVSYKYYLPDIPIEEVEEIMNRPLAIKGMNKRLEVSQTETERATGKQRHSKIRRHE